MSVTFSETIDQTPASLVKMTNFFVSNSSEDATLPLHDSTLTQDDGIVVQDETFVSFRLFESQRTFIIAFSGVPGGDGIPVTIDVLENAVVDLSGNLNIGQNDTVADEVPDNTGPRFAGALLIMEQEYLSLRPTRRSI